MSTAGVSRRVSYILPSPATPPPLLELPGLGERRRGSTSPYLAPKISQLNGKTNGHGTNGHGAYDPFADDAQHDDDEHHVEPVDHPRHCLGITSLALDTSTVLSDAQSPGGILYSGGRDGLVASWELNIPHKRRKGGRYAQVPGRGGKVRWERVGDGAEMFDEDEEDENVESYQRQEHDEDESEDEEPLDTYGGQLDRISEGVRRKRSAKGEIPYEDRWEVDTEAVGQSVPATTFRQSAQTHTDWVNAMLLCNLNQTVITASADRTIQAWSPHSTSSAPSLVGRHRDYVKSLAWARWPSLLFSGALDRQIAIWDVHSPDHEKPLLSIDLNKADDWGGVGLEGERGSIYALGVDPTGRVLAAGTPERVIRMWDPRVGDKTIGKLIGHSDCVRSIVMSDDGKHMLTGSSDCTIKLWSLAAHRCLHTFNHHSSSVWSLFSNHPNLERFYSGSRDGILAAVDVEGVGDISDGECVVLAREGWIPGKYGDYESKTGDEGIRSIVAMDDEYVWTATGSAEIKRWKDVGRRIKRLGAHVDGVAYSADTTSSDADRTGQALDAPLAPVPVPDGSIKNKRLSFDENGPSNALGIESRESRSVAFAPPPNPRESSSSSNPHNLSPNNLSPAGGISQSTLDRLGAQPRRTTFSGASVAGSIMSDVSGQDDGAISAGQNGIPYQSLVCLGIPDSPYSFGFAHVHRSGDMHDATPDRRPSLGGEAVPVTAAAKAARDEFEEREVASEAMPLRQSPDAVIEGRPGLVRSIILNDRQHVLTVDTGGEVAVWNIVKGICVGRYATQDVAAALDLERGMSAGPAVRKHSVEVLEMVKERIEGETMIITWCAVDTKIGSLVVHLEEGRVFDAEVYADESGVPSLEGVRDDIRLNLGKWTLANLFRGLIRAEEREIIASSPTTTLSSLPSTVQKSPDTRSVPIERGPGSHPHRTRALTGSFSSQKSPALSVPGLATPAARAAILPEKDILSQSAPASSNPFQSFQALRGSLPAIAQTPGSDSVAGPQSPGENGKTDYFSLNKKKERSGSISESKEPPTPGSVSGPGAQTPATPGGGSKLKLKFGKKKKETPMSPVVESKEVIEEVKPVLSREGEQLLILDTVRSHPFHPPSQLDAPPVDLPPQTAVLISEESKDAGAWVVTYRSQVDSTEQDMVPLEMNSPLWLLDYLFTGRTKAKDPVKLTFILEPEPGCGLKEMPEGTTRLSASRILRARKILAFIFDKLELGQARARASSTVSASSRITAASRKIAGTLSQSPPPAGATQPLSPSITEHTPNNLVSEGTAEDTIELVCGNHVVDPKMTLATLKQYYGSGGDMHLHYRPKKGVALA